MLRVAVLVPVHSCCALAILIEDPAVPEDDDRAEQTFQAVQQARMRGQLPGPTEKQVQSIAARHTSPKRRPRPLQLVTIVPNLLGREDRDRVDKAQFLIASQLLGREDLLSRDRHPLASWLMGQRLMKQTANRYSAAALTRAIK